MLLFGGTAHGSEAGLAGYTGKPYEGLPQGQSCNVCHAGGTAPALSLDGPTSLNAGEVGDYALVVTTGQRASGGVAATDGVVLTARAGFRESFGEMVQSAPQSGGGTFRFTVTAPAYGGTIRLWASGLASNGSGTGGDRAAQLVRDVTIVGPAAPADAGASSSGGPPPDAGSSSGRDSGGSNVGSSSGDAPDDLAGDEDEDDGNANPRQRSSASPRAGSCSSGFPGASPESTFAVLVGVLAVAVRRRRATSCRASGKRS